MTTNSTMTLTASIDPSTDMKDILENFEFLAWLRLVAFFRDDLCNQLVRLGMDEADAFITSRYDAVKQADVVLFYQEWGRDNPEMFRKFIEDCWHQYNRIK